MKQKNIIKKENTHISFPLDSLLQRLELAGFVLSPATRQRIYETLDVAGIRNLKTPEKLKFILAPIIATSASEQEQFYQIFDSYLSEIQQPYVDSEKKEAPIKWWEQLPKWVWAILPVLLILLSVGYGIWIIFQEEKELKAYFQHEPIVTLGDSLFFQNLSENTDDLCSYQWEIFDRKDGQAELITKDSIDLKILVDSFRGSPKKRVLLTVQHQENGQKHVHESYFDIHCKNKPQIILSEDNPTGNLKIGEKYIFAVANEGDSLNFVWNFGKEQSKKGKRISHTFDKSGSAQILVTATRKKSKAICTTTKKVPVSIEQSKAFLAYKPLLEDKIVPTAYFDYGSWIIWLLTGIGMMWYLTKWLKRKAPESPKPDEKTPSITSEIPDRSPYYIPFQSRNNLVKIDRSLFRFADVLRLRQAGFRQQIDVPKTIQTTIDSGGFPNLSSSITTRPTEYLFLIDDLAKESHQTKLFAYLADFLRDRDVLVEVFYYKNELNRFWNKSNNGGISLEMLQRLYANHRVLIFGNGHGFLDPFAKEKPALRPNLLPILNGWKYRALFSPLPVVSWNYHEKVLYDAFDIFPADMAGLQTAMVTLEQGKDEEEHPNFERWQARFSENRHETDVNYRKWRRIADFKNYLSDHPKIFLWLSALAVYPNPNWSLTIAIGKALAPFGVEVTYDNLLLLSRIPWLQNGNLSPKLRMAFLDSLSEAEEHAARTAVKEELEAVQDQVENSHAQVEHQSNLAIQDFVLSPSGADNQLVIKELLAAGLLSKKQLAELNLGLKRHFTKANKIQKQATKKVPTNANFAPPAPDLATFLSENEQPPIPPPRPFFTPDFAKAATLGSLFFLSLLAFWLLNKTEQLYEFAYQEKPVATYKKAEDLRKGIFISEDIVVDSAVIYNNIGREYQAHRKMRRSEDPDGRDAPQYISFADAEKSFKNALQIRKDYPLATHNLAKLYYNEGARKYHQVLRDSVTTDSLEQAFLLFYKATDVLLDSLLADGYHGMGLTDYYSENYLKADSTLLFIEENTENSFFDTLSTIPNLKTLMTIRKQAVLTEKELAAQQLRDSLDLERRKAIREDKRNREIPNKTQKPPNKKPPIPRDNQRLDYATARIFSIDGKYGLWDKNETVIVEPTYDYIGDFDAIFPDLAEVELNKKVGLINKKGELIVPLEYETIQSIYYQKERLKTVAIIKTGAVEGIINAKGEVVIAPQYDRIRMKERDVFLVKNGKEEFEVDMDGKRIEENEIPLTYQDELIIQALENNMVSIPSGTFTMGCTEEQENCGDDEKPLREVSIRSFKMNKYEVTQEEWRAVMGEDPPDLRFEGCDKCPVERVSWDDIQEFLQKLNKITGKNYRMPSEAEWEYAARGNEKYQYAGSNDVNEVAWYFDNSDNKTQPVGTKKSNGFGLYDMSGNVYEWCQDWYYGSYKNAPTNGSAWTSGGGSYRVLRGGSWYGPAKNCRVSNRHYSNPDNRITNYGCRLAHS